MRLFTFILCLAWTYVAADTLTLQSSAFPDQGNIPSRYSCEGGAFPPLEVSGVPKEAKSLAFVVEDPDAPGRVFVHWVVWNVDPQTKEVFNPRGLGTQGQNSYGNMGWNAPCPPSGQTHRYVFKVYALDSQLELRAGSIRQQLDHAMRGHILQSAEFTGFFSN